MTPEQRALLQKAEENLSAARLLLHHGRAEPAASRAYYVMLYVAEALLLGEGLTFSKHSAVHAAFGRHFAKTGRVPAEFHRYLIRAQEVRHIADYSTTAVSPTDAAEQADRAERFVTLANDLLGSA